ncbi:MAG: hypothetical protein LBD17_05475 [Endomicrobium sp.]|nr:hypothetical protein [Endomicrobium sp.]
MHLDVNKYCSDWYEAYNIITQNHHLCGKAHMYTVERTNRRLRYYLARLVRKTYCFSKSKEMLCLLLYYLPSRIFFDDVSLISFFNIYAYFAMPSILYSNLISKVIVQFLEI